MGSVTSDEPLGPESEALYEEIATYPIDDTHCHPVTDKDAQTTPQRFLERLALVAFPVRAYFPAGVYQEWREGDAQRKNALNEQYKIEATLAEITYHIGESVFVKFMVKEMAQFLGCAPNLNEVIEARNERGKDYWKYVNDLFRDVNIEHTMLDTGFSEGMGAEGIGTFEKAAPSRRRNRDESTGLKRSRGNCFSRTSLLATWKHNLSPVSERVWTRMAIMGRSLTG